MVGRGGFGDMFPMLAVAQALVARGHPVTVAAEHHHGPTLATAGIPFVATDAVQPRPGGFRSVRDELAAFLSPRSLEQSFERVLEAAGEAELIVGNQGGYAGRLVSRYLGKPWVYCAVSPLALPSRHDPPLWPGVHGMQRALPAWPWLGRQFLFYARWVSRALMQPQIRFQKRLGIWDGRNPRFEGLYSDQLNLLMVSPALIQTQPDWPAPTQLTGYAWFEPHYLSNPHTLERHAHFMAAGAPPVVVAPGGSARLRPGAFYQAAMAACRQLGRRCVLLASPRFLAELQALAGDDPAVLVIPYMPYSQLLPGAAALIHSGGIGALGWAARYEVPSLMMPGDWDQYDNVRLAERAGWGHGLFSAAPDASVLTRALGGLLGDERVRAGLVRAYPQLNSENGAQQAAQAIGALLG